MARYEVHEDESFGGSQIILLISFIMFVIIALMTVWSGIQTECWHLRRRQKKDQPRSIMKVPSTIKIAVMPGHSICFAQRLDEDDESILDVDPPRLARAESSEPPLYRTESLNLSGRSLNEIIGVDDSSVHSRKSVNTYERVPEEVEIKIEHGDVKTFLK
eukprot:TRINITY_DN19830_c0_g1_i3.p2 TRINITY_DN19830_c0_g1~~TRINITY_DN19830_c0_g1_i3.p2  ORF type:complete len:160 (+),score=22.94 TRINITY_DN19830_c0_g1_i3:216-695(+)